MENIFDINQINSLNRLLKNRKLLRSLLTFGLLAWSVQTINTNFRKIVTKNGKVVLVKINVDENQDIASQLNIQSIPTVYGFVDGNQLMHFKVQPREQS